MTLRTCYGALQIVVLLLLLLLIEAELNFDCWMRMLRVVEDASVQRHSQSTRSAAAYLCHLGRRIFRPLF